MSIGIFWFETLAVAIVWVGALSKVSRRIGRPGLRHAVQALIFFVPFAALGLFAAATGYLKLRLKTEHSCFAYALTLFLFFLVGGATAMRYEAGATSEAAPAPGRWTQGQWLIALLFLIALWSMTFWNMDLAALSEISSIRVQAGAEMLSVAPPMVSDRANAARLYEKAFSRLKQEGDALPTQVYQDTVLSTEDSAIVTGLLARQRQTLIELRQSAGMPECRWDRDYAHPSISMLLPELTEIRKAAQLLAIDAQVQASQGSPQIAIEDIIAMERMSHQIGSEPIIISALVAWGIDAMSINRLQVVLPAVNNARLLQQLELDDLGASRRVLVRAAQGEEAFGLATLADLANGDLNPEELSLGDASPASRPMRVASWALPLFRVFFLSDSLQGYAREMDDYLQTLRAGTPYSALKSAADRDQLANSYHYGLFAALMVPALQHISRTAMRREAQNANARVAVAMTAYRLDEGHFPGRLAELVPKYLAEVPLDPFDGRELRMWVQGEERTVYSVGSDADSNTPVPGSEIKHRDLSFRLTVQHPSTAPSR